MFVVDVAPPLVGGMAFYKYHLGSQRFWQPQGLPLQKRTCRAVGAALVVAIVITNTAPFLQILTMLFINFRINPN
jgi:hypothetical protein